jgi:hypothetical protein
VQCQPNLKDSAGSSKLAGTQAAAKHALVHENGKALQQLQHGASGKAGALEMVTTVASTKFAVTLRATAVDVESDAQPGVF